MSQIIMDQYRFLEHLPVMTPIYASVTKKNRTISIGRREYIFCPLELTCGLFIYI